MSDIPASSQERSIDRRTGFGWGTILIAATPLMVIASLCGCYALAPDFYLTYILEYRQREHQAVEIVTTLCGLASGLLMLYCAAVLWRAPSQRLMRSAEGGTGSRWPGILADRGGAKIVLILGLAAIFFTGEEISWGQTYLQWDTPEQLLEHNRETNLHNLDHPLGVSLNSLGSTFILVMMVGLPLAWHFAPGLRLPRTWKPAIAEWPVAFSTLVAFGWKEVKNVYKLAGLRDRENPTALYTDFIDQLNEHKEMLVAITLLMYALYRLGAARRARYEDGAHENTSDE